jgi:choline dehydrogenase-like flavoprotein
MIRDLERISDPLNEAADICIIGGGVAGQALANKLAAQYDVIILESGGQDFRSDVQDMAKGDSVGEPYYPLESSRLRLFGGTAAIWGGRCAELDPIDFEKREFLAHSGWPITKDDLDPYYKQTFDGLGLKRPGAGRLWMELGKIRPDFDPDKLDTDLWVFDERGERFTDLNRGNLDKAKIILNASVTSIDINPQGQIESVLAKSLNKGSAEIKAKVFVLAAGTIETVRLLLGAVPNRPQGLGNDHDQLGRFFMEHPHARGGEIIPEKLSHALTVLPRALRVDGRRYAAYMRPSPKLQRERGILNTSISFAARRREGERMEGYRAAVGKLKHDLPSSRFWRSLYHGAKSAAIRGLEFTDPWSSIAAMKLAGGKSGVFAVVRAEQAPNPNSRITLSDERDALGMRRSVLDWQFLSIDRDSVRVLMETLADEYERLGWGKVIPSDWLSDSSVQWKSDELISAHPLGGYHHMGGTRMSDDPKQGVVDKNCKLHDSPNLYIASSSVFPTGGWANPTITIMALARRLGDHLQDQLAKRG